MHEGAAVEVIRSCVGDVQGSDKLPFWPPRITTLLCSVQAHFCIQLSIGRTLKVATFVYRTYRIHHPLPTRQKSDIMPAIITYIHMKP